MKWLFKWFIRLIVMVILLGVLLFVFKNDIARALTEYRIRSVTGMDVKIGRLSASAVSPVLTIEDLRLYNTAEFGGTLFLRAPELHVEYDGPALAQRKLRVTLMRLNLAELNIVRNEAGKTNIVELADDAHKRESAFARNLFGDVDFQGVEVLNLSLDTVRCVDLKDARQNREFHVNVHDQISRNLRTETDLYGLFMLLWQRTGGALGMTPADAANHFVKEKIQEISPPLEAPARKPQ